MDDRVTVEVVEIGGNTIFEFGLRCDADMAEHRARHFGKEALNEVEPRAVFRGEHEAKRPSGWVASQAPVSFEMWAE